MTKRVWAGACAYFIVFSLLGADRYIAHRSAQDFGIFYQSIAGAFSGFSNTIEGANHFTVHFSPILLLFAPLLWMTHSGLPLVLVQAAANACVAPALYLIARRRVDERAALGIASIAFFYPPLWGVTFTDFHENGLVAATIVWLLYALDARKYRRAAVFAFVALCIKEDQALFLAILCVAAFLYFRRTAEPAGARWSLWTGAFSLLTFAAYFAVVREYAGAIGTWHPVVFYTVTQPAAVVTPLRGLTDRLGYVFLAFAPLVFVPFRLRILLLAVAPFAEVLLSRAPVTYTMGQHYAAVWIPYVLVAFVLGACDLQNRKPLRARAAMRAAFTICAVILLVANPLHPKYFLRIPQSKDRQLDAFIATLPAKIDVGTQEEAYTHMGFYPNATLGMERFPQYALFDWNYPDSNWVIRDGAKMRAALAAGRYKIARSNDGIVLYERVGPKPARPAYGPVW
ncbi:MAG: DUF2079 domain-containing protein [Candidatus Eremiobacteraeota bacterium]|nr:DUF2079 domain-containing protein [Candidatus Eremiobacteraeota bacterium]